MSWILITTLVIFALFGFAGWRKGIIRIVVSIAALLIAVLATAFFSPLVTETLKKNTKIYDHLCETMYQAVSNNDRINETVDTTIADSSQVTINESEISQYENKLEEYLDRISGAVNLPEQYGEKLSEMTSNEILSGVLAGESTVRDIVVGAFAIRLADIILQAIVYIIMFVVIYVVLQIVVVATGVIAKLPVIHGANKLLGLVFGLVEGLLVVWILFTALTAFSGVDSIATALADINNHWFLQYLYQHNVIMKMIFR